MVSILKRKGNRYFLAGWHNIGNLKCRYTKGKDFFGDETITIYWSEEVWKH